MDMPTLQYEERIVFALRDLYSRFGYLPFRMSKFEEYDLYARNKDFLVSDNVITFTDTNGKLMALKPDVTLSIVRSTRDTEAGVHKLYYNENVYRVSGSTRSFREIMQTGVECIGHVDDYCILEVLMLAAESLRAISEECVLDLSHMDVVSAMVDALGVGAAQRGAILKCIGGKNMHELAALCASAGAAPEAVARLETLIRTAGRPETVLPALAALGCPADALEKLSALTDGLTEMGFGDMLRIDFSVVNDMDYYNGVVFKGFVAGVPGSVISGGQYDKLMRRMGRRAGAVGFAVYLDMLERFSGESAEYDVDTLLLYDETAESTALLRAVKQLSRDGNVMAQCAVPEKLKYRRLARLRGNEVEYVEQIS